MLNETLSIKSINYWVVFKWLMKYHDGMQFKLNIFKFAAKMYMYMYEVHVTWDWDEKFYVSKCVVLF